MSESITLNVEAVTEDRLPAIIKTEVEGLSEYRKKKEEAREKAEVAKSLADKMQGVKAFKTKAAVEELQEAAKAFGEAQVLTAEAQEKSFEYQEKLASASKYLFALGVTNMSMNRSVVRELRATLEGADSSNLDDLAQQEIENVISQLLAQEDIMSKQEKMADTIDAIDDEVSSHREQIQSNAERIIRNEETTVHQSKLIEAGIFKDKEHDRLLLAGKKKDEEQDALISAGVQKDIVQDRLLAEKTQIDAEQTHELESQHKKDIEHDERLANLEEIINELKRKTEDVVPIKKYRMHMILMGLATATALVIAIVELIL